MADLAFMLTVGLTPALPAISLNRRIHLPDLLEPAKLDTLLQALGKPPQQNEPTDERATGSPTPGTALTPTTDINTSPHCAVLDTSKHASRLNWIDFTATHLSRVLRRSVTGAIHEAPTQTDRLSSRSAEFLSLHIQMHGIQKWTVWPEFGTVHPYLTHPGDVLILPQGTLHDISTPDPSDTPLHLAFAITGPRHPPRLAAAASVLAA